MDEFEIGDDWLYCDTLKFSVWRGNGKERIDRTLRELEQLLPQGPGGKKRVWWEGAEEPVLEKKWITGYFVIQQPTPQAIRLCRKNLRGTLMPIEVEVAHDIECDDPVGLTKWYQKRATLRWYNSGRVKEYTSFRRRLGNPEPVPLKNHFEWHRKTPRISYFDDTLYIGDHEKRGDRDPDRCSVAIYGDKPCKFTGNPCTHIEARYSNPDACRNAGFHEIEDVLDETFIRRAVWGRVALFEVQADKLENTLRKLAQDKRQRLIEQGKPVPPFPELLEKVRSTYQWLYSRMLAGIGIIKPSEVQLDQCEAQFFKSFMPASVTRRFLKPLPAPKQPHDTSYKYKDEQNYA